MTLLFDVNVPRPTSFALDTGVSRDAVELLRSSDVMDMHIDSHLGSRIYRYDMLKQNGAGPFDGWLFGQMDVPRSIIAGLTGPTWSIVANPFRRAASRFAKVAEALRGLRAIAANTRGRVAVVRTYREYAAARAVGSQAAFLAVQGGNAFESASAGEIAGLGISRVTLVHLTNSKLGGTSSPLGFLRPNAPLTERGAAVVQTLNEQRIIVDLAHASKRTFWDAANVHAKDLPIVVSHTGVSGVTPHWRNIDDEQIRRVADSGGVVGVMFQRSFLRRKDGPRDGKMIVEHLKHLVDVGGEDIAAIGSDYDGAIIPPPGFESGATGYVRLIELMMAAGFSNNLIRKIIGLNVLRVLRAMDR